MKLRHVRRSILCLVVAALALTQVPAAVAGNGAPKTSPGRRPVEVTFTKWITDNSVLPYTMEGFVEGSVPGLFAGEVLDSRPTRNGRFSSLEAIYQVIADNPARSFTALIRGGRNNETNTAILDGVIIGGWRTGAPVHVEFDVLTNCPGAPLGRCFRGTIEVDHGGAR
jgi:hypothetical protein